MRPPERRPAAAPGAAFELPVRVYYQDTDAGGVVYHGSYLNYFERARTEYVPPGAVAVVYARLGDTLNQDLWLMRAYEERSNALAYLLVDTPRIWRPDATVRKLIAAVGLQ